MKKIAEGRYELTCTKEEAIERFQEMAGYCREHISDDRAIAFYCTKKGKISVSDPHRKKGGIFYDSPTTLRGQIVEEEDKTYLTYYTIFSMFESVTKVVCAMLYILIGIFALVSAIVKWKSALTVIICIAFVAFFIRRIYVMAKEKSHAVQDSEIMIKVLEERVNAVNRWDE